MSSYLLSIVRQRSPNDRANQIGLELSSVPRETGGCSMQVAYASVVGDEDVRGRRLLRRWIAHGSDPGQHPFNVTGQCGVVDSAPMAIARSTRSCSTARKDVRGRRVPWSGHLGLHARDHVLDVDDKSQVVVL